MTDDVFQLSLTEASRLVERREVSPLELTEQFISRCKTLDPTLNAFITPTFESAQQEATRATEEIAAGKRRSPLHGIPFALKDLYETAGVLTTAGSRLREDYVPTEDAHVVALLRDAGVVFLGKLTMHEWALGGTNISEFFPTPRNPWNLDHVAGGSSGGSGVAVSAGLCLGSLGSDTAGSIRIPASFCGITGLKPTYGRVSIRGVVPLNWSLDHAGPMARTASDCAMILQAIAGYDDDDPTCEDIPVPDYIGGLQTDIKGLRIGVPANFFFDADAVEPAVASTVRECAQVFASLGATVQEILIAEPEQFAAQSAFLADAGSYHQQHLSDRSDAFSDGIRTRLTESLEILGVDYSRSRYEQLRLKRTMQRLFREVDLILTPTEPMVAPSFADAAEMSPLPIIRNTRPFNVAGVPVISVPCGFHNGLPIGLSLAGRPWGEETVLRAAHAFQSVTDWHKKRPSV